MIHVLIDTRKPTLGGFNGDKMNKIESVIIKRLLWATIFFNSITLACMIFIIYSIVKN